MTINQKKNAYALNTPHVAVFIVDSPATPSLKSSISGRHSIEVPIETFFDLVTLTFDL